MENEHSEHQTPSADGSEEHASTSHRRSFLKVVGGAALGALAAVSGLGSRSKDVQATHPPEFGYLHDGQNTIQKVSLMNGSVPVPGGAALDVSRGMSPAEYFNNEADEMEPAVRGIRGSGGGLDATAGVVGRHIDSGIGVAGVSDAGTGVQGEGVRGVHARGLATGVLAEGPVGLTGNGDVGVVGSAGDPSGGQGTFSGVGVVGVGRNNIPTSGESNDVMWLSEPHYYSAGNDEITAEPNYEGVGMRAFGGTAVEGIADSPMGAGVIGANDAADGGVGVFGNAPSGTGVIGVGVVGLRGIAVDEDGNVVGDGVVGEGTTGVVGKSSEANGVGIQGESLNGVGVQGNSENSDGVRGSSQTGDGVHGLSADALGHGIRGENVHGEGVRGNGKTGVRGSSDSEDGEGVRGEGRTGVRGNSNRDDGEGVRGEGRTGVRGNSNSEEGEGVRGEGRTGVRGNSNRPDGEGVRGEGNTGVRGKSSAENGVGVAGENDNGVAVEGRGRVGVRGVANGQGNPQAQGVSSTDSSAVLLNTGSSATLLDAHLPTESVAIQGLALGAGTIGIQAKAESEGATALKVETTTKESVALEVVVPEGGTAVHIKGAACFDTVGMGSFAPHTSSATVSDPRVTAQSFIYAMITGDPRVGLGTDMVAVQWIERHPGTGFTVHLNSQIKRETPFSYFIVEPCPEEPNESA